MRYFITGVIGLISIYLITAIFITSFAVLHSNKPHKGDVIIVLGSGMSADGTLGQGSVKRVLHGVALYNQGAAPAIHFTGGKAAPNGPGAGDQMAALAIENGVPDSAITRENRSLSTLQNALFSKPITQQNNIILVTEGFHLPRSAASFWWMGYDNIHISHAGRLRQTGTGQISLRMINRETLAVWFNLGRALVWSITGKQHDAMLQ